MAKKRVVITGMGVVSCFGSDVDKYYESLLNGESGVSKIDVFPCEEYTTRIAARIKKVDFENYLDKKQARRLDSFIQYGIVAGKKSVEDAKLNLDNVDKSRCGIVIGSGMGGMQTFEAGVETILNQSFKKLSPFFIPSIITNMSGAMLAIEYGFLGPNYSISTACATSNYSIMAAMNHIRNGDADLMVTGGVEAPISPIGLSGFIACRAISQNNENPEQASRPWDKNRDGFVIGEGAGVLVLESLEHAKARGAKIYAELLGGGMTCDAYHMTAPPEDGKTVAMCIENSLKDAGVKKEDVSYVNAHATSTLIGDVAELKAMHGVFGDMSKIKINATKSMTGHGLGAAGGLEAIAVVKAIETGKLHPTINLEDPIEEIEKYKVEVNKEAIDCDVDVSLSNSFGFGGHNSTLVFGKCKE